MKKRYLLLLSLIILLFGLFSTGSASRKSYSPDRQFSVYSAAYNYEMFLFKPPGDGGSASGKVFLYDEIEKKVLSSQSIDMVSYGNDVQWLKQEAYYIGENVPRFELPRPIRLDTTIRMPDGVCKKYTPLGVLKNSYQIKQINGVSYRVYDIYYNKDGSKSIEHRIQFFPNRKKGEEIWQIRTYKSYQNQKLHVETHKQGFTGRFAYDSLSNCGVHFDRNYKEEARDTFPPCYQQ
ncbi:MAG: hypothetical protein ACRBFS_23130 [Aureispira sp.]